MASDFPCEIAIRIPMPTVRLANVALEALQVDQELSPLVRRSFAVEVPSSATHQAIHDPAARAHPEQALLITRYSATTNRMLRVAVNGFFESVGVVIGCMRELDTDVVEAPWVGEGNAEIDFLARVQGVDEKDVIG